LRDGRVEVVAEAEEEVLKDFCPGLTNILLIISKI